MTVEDTREMTLITNFCPDRDAEELFLPALKVAYGCEEGDGQLDGYRGIYAPKGNEERAKALLTTLCNAYEQHFE